MDHTIARVLEHHIVAGAAGRATELAALRECLADTGPHVTFVHGIAGIGKSTLLSAFAATLRLEGLRLVQVECDSLEPTERGFVHELGVAIGVPAAAGLAEFVRRLAAGGSRLVLVMDTYERLRLLDTWLRQVFVPALPDNVRLIVAGREQPHPAWGATSSRMASVRSIRLGTLADADAELFLCRAGMSGADARKLNHTLHGHPLALQIAASVIVDPTVVDLQDAAIGRVVGELTRLYLTDLDRLTRRAMTAAAVVRRVTVPLLQALLPEADPVEIYDCLQGLPIVTSSRDGLAVHETVQGVIATGLRAADPVTYRAMRRAAWAQLRRELRTAASDELWRYTADMLFLIENPVVREAFFPTDTHVLAVEPAKPDDEGTIREIAYAHEPPTAAAALIRWWNRLPSSFHIVRDRNGSVTGFYVMAEAGLLKGPLLDNDPVTAAWVAHLRREPVPRGQRVLMLRRWLDRDVGDRPCRVQAACWLDIKRTYLELRPDLRRLYTVTSDYETYEPVITRLGFRPVGDAHETGGRSYRCAMLDFGLASVDGWLSTLAAAELGVTQEELLDAASRQLVLDGQRIDLTPLEFELLRYLHEKCATAVSRADLQAAVWGYDYTGGSNVVDSVVAALRRKLGDRAALIETVRGVGYRLASM